MYLSCITGFVRSSHPQFLLLFSRKIANFHRYPTRSNEKRQMEQLQEDMAAMKAQMEAQMAQFMEVITNMNQGQQELRALLRGLVQRMVDAIRSMTLLWVSPVLKPIMLIWVSTT